MYDNSLLPKMEYKIRHSLCLLSLTFLAITQVVSAQEQDGPKPLRFDFTPLIGYRTSMNFTSQLDSGTASPHIILNASPSYGLSLGMRIDEENLVEFRWARQDTKIHLQNVAPRTADQRQVLDQYHGDFTHEYILEEWPGWARPFITGSIGASHLSSGTNRFTRFSFGLGAGIKVYASPHIGFRVQAAWLPLLINPEVRAFICGGGCVVRVGGTLFSQGEFTMGPLLRF